MSRGIVLPVAIHADDVFEAEFKRQFVPGLDRAAQSQVRGQRQHVCSGFLATATVPSVEQSSTTSTGMPGSTALTSLTTVADRALLVQRRNQYQQAVRARAVTVPRPRGTDACAGRAAA